MESPEQAVKVTTRSVGVRYGLMAAAVSIVYFLVLNISGVDMTQGPGRWGGIIFTIILIFLAHKYFKDNGDGFMAFGQGLGIGFWFGLVSSVISSAFTFIYVKFIDASFLDMIKEKQLEAMHDRGMSDEQIDQAMKFASMFTSPTAIFIFGIIGGVLAAFIVALIVGIFTQKKNPEGATLD